MEPQKGKRPAMLASAIRGILASALRECPRECGIVAISSVIVSPEYSNVTVSLSAFNHPEAAVAFFEKRRKELRAALGALDLRRVPELRFVIDEQTIRANRIDELLAKEAKEYPAGTSTHAQG